MILDEEGMRRLVLSDARTLAATRVVLLTGYAGPEGFTEGERIELRPADPPWKRKGRSFRFCGEMRIELGRDRKVNWAGFLLFNRRISPHPLGRLDGNFGTQQSGHWAMEYEFVPPRDWPLTDAQPE